MQTTPYTLPLADTTRRRRVCLILEGTYPYVSGGVSTWVHQIIAAMPDIDFDIHFIGDKKDLNQEFKYELPPNVTSLSESYLFDKLPASQKKLGRGSRTEKAAFIRIISRFLHAGDFATRMDALGEAADVLRHSPDLITLEDLFKNKDSWALLTEAYQQHSPDAPFFRFHSAVRDLATLLWNLIRTAGTLPVADTYHCVCTGYAGLLGALASRIHGAAFLFSEHGVYLKERIEDIRKSTWLADGKQSSPFQGDLGTFKSLWIDFFDLLCRFAYQNASCITALFGGNAKLQIEFGADPAKVAIIPNGIDTSRFASIARMKLDPERNTPEKITVGFLGRVVPIKDVKTLLRSAALTLNTHPNAHFLCAGPTEEDPAYYEECLALVRQLGIENNVSFPGRMKPDDFLEQSDIVILTSISEGLPFAVLEASAAGLPFAVLEASAAGLPVVATDVGSCRELIETPLPKHPQIGQSGLVTEVANPASTAAALCQLVGSAKLRHTLGSNGLQRVEHAYRQEDIIAQYRYLYLSIAPLNLSQTLSA